MRGPAERFRAACLAGLPAAAVAAAAADSFAARWAQDHRPTTPALFGQALLLWSVFALGGTLLALATRALWPRRPSARAAPWLVLFWTAAPVLAHAALDRHTAIGRDLSALAAARPWLELLAAVGLWALVLALAARALRSVSGRRLALVALPLAAAAGAFLPWRGPARPPVDAPSGGAGRPNLLLLVWDTARARSLTPYGSPRDVSPHLARFAEEALVFEEARSASVFTFSSHLSMLTGRFPSRHGGRLVHMRHDPARATGVAQRLSDAGYRTAAFVGTSVLAAETGLDEGFEVYDDQVDPPVCDTFAWALVHDVQSALAALFPALRRNGRPHWFQDFQRPATDVLEAAAEWIAAPDPRPWFCLVNLYDAHWPYLPGEASAARFVGPYEGPIDGFATRGDAVFGTGFEPGPPDDCHLRELYEAELFELDARVAAFLEGLDLERTAVLLTSDHGEAFGEAGVYEHDDLYEPQVRIPFLLRLPASVEGPQGQRSGRLPGPVSGVDVAPTLLALAGLEPGPGSAGLDLTRRVPEPGRTIVVEDRDLPRPGDSRLALYRGPWKLERRRLGGTETVRLFDLREDPVGERDVSAQHPERAAELREALAAWCARQGGEGEGEAEALGDVDALRALGYLEE